MNLTNEEKRVRIAEAIGWTWDDGSGLYVKGWMHDTLGSKQLSEGSRTTKEEAARLLPDYFHSLDAIHEAENAMDTYELKQKFASALYRINESAYIEASYDGEHDYEGYFSLLHSTAAQRAEAFGIALALWPKPPTAAAPQSPKS